MKLHVGLSAVLISAASPSFAQEPAPGDAQRVRPVEEVVSSPSGHRGRHVLTLRSSLFAAYDDDIVDRADGPPAQDARGNFANASADISYRFSTNRTLITLDGGTNVRYYQPLATTTIVENRGAAHVRVNSGRTTFSSTVAVRQAPVLELLLFPTLTETAHADALLQTSTRGLGRRDAWVTDVQAASVTRLNRRDQLSFEVHLERTDASAPEEPDLSTRRLSALYRHQHTRNAAFRLGYEVQGGAFDTARGVVRPRLDSIDAQVEYRRPLSFSRRTTAGVSFGSTMVDEDSQGRRLRAIGSGTLEHQIGRTWALMLIVQRGAGLVEGIAGPVFSNGASIRMGGQLTRRIDVRFTGGLARGTVGAPDERSAYDTVMGSARVRAALSPSIAVFGEYARYAYDVPTGLPVPGLPSNSLSRQAVRIGLSVFAPVWRARK